MVRSNTNNDPMSELKSSPVQILFVPFNIKEYKCNFCGHYYTMTCFFEQKYCKNCLFWYIKYILNDDKYVDVNIFISNNPCNNCLNRSPDFCTSSIREWCENCSEIFYFKQIIPYSSLYFNVNQNKIIEKEKNCGLCGKLIYNQMDKFEFKMCSNCYVISFGQIKSALTKKLIPILYLPWWDTYCQCAICTLDLKMISNCQKWCSHCYLIYTGCRYCLTTNLIFGITDQSQCKKCNRTIYIIIDIKNINSGSYEIEEFLISTRLNINDQIFGCILNNIDKSSNPLDIYKVIMNELKSALSKPMMEWIPYDRLTNLNKIAEGGFGTIYKADWLDGGKYQHEDFLSIRNKNKTVAVKKFYDSQNIKGRFFNELKSLYQCYDNKFDHIIRCYGITQHPTKDYMIVMEYANGGNLHSYLQKNFANITWNKKLYILWQISAGLHTIHEAKFIHRDLHSGNILLEKESVGKWKIGDLGLSQPAYSNTLNNEIYGVIPYIAPEIFKGVSFSQDSDIYSMGMIMWELTTGCKPFYDIEHNIELIYQIVDGKRPEITEDTPKRFAELMKSCWNSDPSERPSAKEIREESYKWSFLQKDNKEFDQAEKERLELIKSKVLGPDFAEPFHSKKTFFTSRSLDSFIFAVSLSSISTTPSNEYITEELNFDIDTG